MTRGRRPTPEPGPPSQRSTTPGEDSRGAPRAREADGWAIMSYMIAGMVLYGGIGWLVGRWTGISVFFPVGMILGIAFSIVLIIYRVTRS